MKAIFNNQVVAEAPQDELIKIEGNWYFPPSAIKQEFFKPNRQHTTCFWKGEASYYDVVGGGETFAAGAWYYPEPKEGSVERVGRDFAGYVAFYSQIIVTE